MSTATSYTPQDRLTTPLRVPIQRSSRLFYGLLILGFVLRVATIFSVGSTIDSDRAVVYLMAKHFSQGDVSTFFWGQTYGGTFLQASAGAAMVFLGRHVEVLEIVSTLIACGVALLVRTIATHAFGQLAGDIAGTIFCFPGVFLFQLSFSDPGFYGPTLLFGLLTMWLALATTRRSGYGRWGVIGFFAGLAFWQSSVGGAFALPGLVWLFWHHRSLKRWAASLVGFLAGASPWLLALLTNGPSMIRPKGTGRINLHTLLTFFTEATPSALLSSVPGTALPAQSHPPAQPFVGALIFALLCMLVAIGIRQRNRWVAALFASTLLSIFLIAVGSVLLTAASARYGFFLLPFVSIALAWLFSRSRSVGYIAMGLIPIVTLYGLLPHTGNFTMDTADRYGRETSQVRAFFLSHKIRSAYGTYWLAYNLTAKNEETMTMAALEPRRYAPYEKNAQGKFPMVIVVYADGNDDRLLAKTAALPTHKRHIVSGYAIYIFDKWFDPYQNKKFTWAHSPPNKSVVDGLPQRAMAQGSDGPSGH